MIYPKISIITPSYNQGDFLEDGILSVISQQYPNLEYILIDGGSTDNSLEIIRKYAEYFNYWICEPDKGQSDAINKGLAKATGEIINWLNADDCYEPQALFKIARYFQETRAKVVCGRCRVFKNPNILSHISPGTDIYPENLAKTIGWARTDQPATFYHREAIEKMGYLDVHLHYLMDRDWWVKYLFQFGLEAIHRTDDILVSFRLHQQSKTVSQQKRFALDRDSYYVALAKMHNLEDYRQFLEDNALIIRDYQIQGLALQDIPLIKRVLNYYCLLKSEEHYAQSQHRQAQIYLDFLDPKLLSEEDRSLWKKIYWRNKYLPGQLVRLLRRVKKLIPQSANH